MANKTTSSSSSVAPAAPTLSPPPPLPPVMSSSFDFTFTGQPPPSSCKTPRDRLRCCRRTEDPIMPTTTNITSGRLHVSVLKNSTSAVVAVLTLIAAAGLLAGHVEAHGRLIEPPSRASAWRYGFQTPPNYNDHELYCGGFQRQQRNGGHCGECGDAWDVPEPRPHEYGGKWGQGVVVRRYQPGAEIALRVELTASHMGYFEFRVCPELAAKQTCLDRHVLELMGGTPSVEQPGDLRTRFYPRNGSRIYDIKGVLPDGLECANCVLQWRYIAGNNWGMCEDGTGAVGCGAQEEFRACADINIGDVGPQPPLRPIRPGTGKPATRGPATRRPTTSTSNTTDAGTATEHADDDDEAAAFDGVSRLMRTVIIVLSALLVVLCFLATIYLYTYHGQRIKQLLHWNREHKQQQQTAAAVSQSGKSTLALATPPPPSQVSVPPVAPPRAKRLMSQSSASSLLMVSASGIGDIQAHGPSVLSGTTLT